MPVLMRSQGLMEPGALFGSLSIPACQQAGVLQHPIHAAGTDRHNIGVDHHVAQAATPFQRMIVIIIEDRLFFRCGQPEVARDPAIVLVDPAVATTPIVKFTPRNANPVNHLLRLDFGFVGPVPHVIDHLVPDIRLGPGVFQSSPRFFLRRHGTP